jgi:hypothetical protein
MRLSSTADAGPGTPLRDVHIVVGATAIVLFAVTGLFGAWSWWRVSPNPWFWRLLRVAQLSIVIQAALGGLLLATGKKASTLHIVYGLLPLAFSFIGEQFRVTSAQTVLDQRGLENAQEVGRLPAEEQHEVVRAIVRRELGVMTLAALIIVVLLARAASTG